MERIPLGPRPGRFALIDKADLPLIAPHRWTLTEGPPGYPVAVALIKGRLVRMHRLILGYPMGDVDHLNGDRLDNRRQNLRVVSHAANLWNSATPIGESGFRCVTRTRSRSRWRAQIRHESRCLHLGTFDSAVEAASAYDAAVSLFRDEFATRSDGKRRIQRAESASEPTKQQRT